MIKNRMIKRLMKVGAILTCFLMAFTHCSCSLDKAQGKILQKELEEMRKKLPLEMAPGVSIIKVSVNDKRMSYDLKIEGEANEMRAKLSDEGGI